jgi:hypothetical protein
MLLGILAAAFFNGLLTSLKVLALTDERETARSLAEIQMEHIEDTAYSASYAPAPIPDEYSGYSAAINAASISSRTNIQHITVTIQHEGVEVLELEGYKYQ